MGCSCACFFAIFVGITAAAMSAIAVSLPLWSSFESTHGFISQDQIKSGSGNTRSIFCPWGFCANEDLVLRGVRIKAECFPWFLDASIVTRFASGDLPIDGSICEAHQKNTVNFAALFPVGGFQFLTDTCETYGKLTLGFAVAAASFGGLMALMLLMSLCCSVCTGCFIPLAVIFGVKAVISTITALSLWKKQSESLRINDNAKHDTSFHLAHASIYVYILAIVLMILHFCPNCWLLKLCKKCCDKKASNNNNNDEAGGSEALPMTMVAAESDTPTTDVAYYEMGGEEDHATGLMKNQSGEVDPDNIPLTSEANGEITPPGSPNVETNPPLVADNNNSAAIV